MALLRSGAARYKFEVEITGKRGPAFYAAYGGSVAPKRLLWHIARARAGDEPGARLTVNKVWLGSQTGGSGKSIREGLAGTMPPELIPQFELFAREHSEYTANLAALASLRDKYAVMTRDVAASKKAGPAIDALKRKIAEGLSECGRVEKELRGRYPGSLGTPAELAKKGVVEFGFRE